MDELLTVTEDEIAYSLLTLMEKQKVVCEGAGTVALAAVYLIKLSIKEKNVCVI